MRRLGRLPEQQAGRYGQGDPEQHLQAFPDPADAFAAADRRAMALALLGRLPPGQRQVLWLRTAAGFSEAETAQILSVTSGTVKSQLHYATTKIKKLESETRDDEWRTGPR